MRGAAKAVKVRRPGKSDRAGRISSAKTGKAFGRRHRAAVRTLAEYTIPGAAGRGAEQLRGASVYSRPVSGGERMEAEAEVAMALVVVLQ